MEQFFSGIPDVLWYALIISFFSTVSPLTLAYLTNKHTRRDRQEDWARQDAVALHAARAAELLVADNKKVAATAALAIVKLDVIHTLVNSSLTEAMQSEYEAVKRELILINEVINLGKAAGREPSPATLTEVSLAEIKVGTLSQALSDRLKSATQAAMQVKAAIPEVALVKNGTGMPSTTTPG
jgi:hypothetical protein